MMPFQALRLRQSFTAMGNPYRDAVLADSPAAYFRLNETTGDFFNLVDGSVSAAQDQGSLTRGLAPLNLDVDDKSISIASTGRVVCYTNKYKYNTNFAFEAIIKIDTGALSSAASLGVMSKCTGGGYLRVSQSGTVGQGRLHWIRSQTADLGQSSMLLSENTVYHVGVSVSSTGVPTFYVNGSAAGTGVTNTDFTESLNVLLMGCDVGGEYFTGRLDEIAIYGSALSSGRWLAHAQAAGLA